MNTYIWLAIMVCSIFVEVSTSGLVAIWFAAGAFVSMLLSIMKLNVGVQIGAFVVISALLLVLFYKKLKDSISQKVEKTNIHALIGKIGIAEDDIEEMKNGRVRVSGMSWSAYINGGSEPIKKGDKVKVLAIDGVKLLCERVKEIQNIKQ